ncbi:MAG: APC family permease [Mycoplasma sp.]
MTNQKRFGKTTSQPVKGANAKKVAKFGLFGSIAIVFTSIIGTGVFFKNKSIFQNNNGNPWGVLLSWGLVGLLTLATAFSYAEISKVKTKSDNSGLPGWIERYIGYRFSRFLKLAYPLFYYGLFSVVLSVFAGEAFFNMFPTLIPGTNINLPGKIFLPNFGLVLVVGFALVALFTVVNLLSSMASAKISKYFSFVKFGSLSFIMIAALVLFFRSPTNNMFDWNNYITVDPFLDKDDLGGQFSGLGIINSAPAVMFAFDGFLIVGNLRKEVNNPEKTVPWSIVLSMIICGAMYMIIAVIQLLAGVASPYLVFQLLFANNLQAANGFVLFVSMLIFISLFASTNSNVLGCVHSCQAVIEEEIIFGWRWFKKIANGKRSNVFGGAVLGAFITLFWFLVAGIPSIVFNTDNVIDGMGNTLVIFFFVIYGIVPLFSLKWWCKVPESEVKHSKSQIFTAPIGAIACVSVSLYVMVYTFFIEPIIKGLNAPFTEWGLFFSGSQLLMWEALIVFWLTVVLFFTLPFINDLLLKKYDKHNKQALIWQKPKHEFNPNKTNI